MSFSVFLSHCMVAEDAPLVDSFVGRLGERDIQCYLAERDPQPGANLADKVVERIRDSDLVAVFWTRKGASSEWVNQEVGVAKAAGKLVVPIVERGVAPKGMLLGVERVEFDRDNPERALESLEEFLSRRREEKIAAEEGAELRRQLMLVGICTALIVALVIVLAFAAKE